MLCKDYTMIKHSNKQLISNYNLTKHFENHFKESDIEIQPEVINPNNYSHILPSHDLQINSDLYTFTKIKEPITKFKNGKCQGTDLLHPGHLKYNKSNRFSLYLPLLMTTIWTTFAIPSAWLISHITCSFKSKGGRSDSDDYRGLSIMPSCSKILTYLVIGGIRNIY